MKTEYFDIHTHRNLLLEDSVLSILNFDPVNNMKLHDSVWFSTGIHPWNLPLKNSEWFMMLIMRLIRHDHCVAIGECGLDYSKKTEPSIQISLFKNQALIAENARLPLIIHCVVAFHDLLKIKNELNPILPWIIHGYSKKSVATAKQLIQAGFYLSVGTKALDSSFSDVISEIPIDRLFIESDDSDVEIQEVYKAVSLIKNIDYEMLKKSIRKNVMSCFSKIEIQ